MIVSDKDDLDAVLPVGVVRSLLARTLRFRFMVSSVSCCFAPTELALSSELGVPKSELPHGAGLRDPDSRHIPEGAIVRGSSP